MFSPISIRPEFFACVTSADVLENVSIYDWADGGACVQQYSIGVDDIISGLLVVVCVMMSPTCSYYDPAIELDVDDRQFPA